MAGAGQPTELHTIRVAQPLATLNRLQIVVHFAVILALIYYRASTFRGGRKFVTVSWFLLSIAELILAFLWVLSQAFRWRPVERTVYPDRLPEDSCLPSIDVFICTADPEKEPTMEVMNTLVSSMCLDYPPDKLHVYLSDNGGSQLTLCATKLAYGFARSWLPFCRRYKIETRCPEAYFSSWEKSSRRGGNREFLEEEKKIQLLYGDLKRSVEKSKEAIRLTRSSTKNGGHRLSHVEIGFLYGSVVEDYYTEFHLHCRGWVSTYCYPSRPAFLGSVPISFHDTLVQNKRWMSGLLQVGFSKFCPLTYGLSSRTSAAQMMCYAWPAFQSLYSVSILLYGSIPQLCFSKGIPMFPPLTSPWFALFGLVHASSLCQHLTEVLRCGGSLTMWFNELRFWLIISVTAYLFACLNMVMKLLGFGEVNFDLTNKSVGEEQVRMYENGVFDFEGTSLMLLPLITLTILNVTTFIRGVWRLIFVGYMDELFGQFILSVAVLVISYPVLEGIIIRRDKGRVPSFITMWSIISAMLLQLLFG